MFFIDIAVPRDVDPEMNKVDGIFVYDIDDLQQAVASHVADRRKEAERAEAIISSEVERFQARLQTLDVVPTIVSLQDHLETIRQAEIDRVRGRLGPLISRTGTGDRDADARHREQNHAYAHQHLEDRGARVRSHHRRRSGAPACSICRRKASGREARSDESGGTRLMARLRIGSRGSQLALWQANHICALLRERGHEVELEIIKTTGDKITDVALAKVGTKGMFTKEIEEALAEGRVDLAVHSLKDLPTELPPGFEIAAITTRENPQRRILFGQIQSIDDLPQAGAGRHQQPAPPGAIEGAAARSRYLSAARQCRHSLAQARSRENMTPSFWPQQD